MSLRAFCDQCQKTCGADFLAGILLLPPNWIVDGNKHFCSNRCRHVAGRASEPKRGRPVTSARDEWSVCACGAEYGDHSQKPPHRCRDTNCAGFALPEDLTIAN